MDTIKFEWDENKNQTNQKKHGISFEEAKEVFFDDDAILFDDPEHSKGEERFLIIGLIQKEKICIVSHCYRDKENTIRIIQHEKQPKTKRKYTQIDGRGEKHETRIRHQKSEPQKKPVRKTAKTANHNKH